MLIKAYFILRIPDDTQTVGQVKGSTSCICGGASPRASVLVSDTPKWWPVHLVIAWSEEVLLPTGFVHKFMDGLQVVVICEAQIEFPRAFRRARQCGKEPRSCEWRP